MVKNDHHFLSQLILHANDSDYGGHDDWVTQVLHTYRNHLLHVFGDRKHLALWHSCFQHDVVWSCHSFWSRSWGVWLCRCSRYYISFCWICFLYFVLNHYGNNFTQFHYCNLDWHLFWELSDWKSSLFKRGNFTLSLNGYQFNWYMESFSFRTSQHFHLHDWCSFEFLLRILEAIMSDRNFSSKDLFLALLYIWNHCNFSHWTDFCWLQVTKILP